MIEACRYARTHPRIELRDLAFWLRTHGSRSRTQKQLLVTSWVLLDRLGARKLARGVYEIPKEVIERRLRKNGTYTAGQTGAPPA